MQGGAMMPHDKFSAADGHGGYSLVEQRRPALVQNALHGSDGERQCARQWPERRLPSRRSGRKSRVAPPERRQLLGPAGNFYQVAWCDDLLAQTGRRNGS